MIGTIAIDDFEIAPVAIFLPGAFVAATGKLDANLTVRGLDANRKIRGRIEVDHARVPLAPTIGTLRDANADVTIDELGMRATIDGKLGGGKVAVSATSGHDLAVIDSKIVLDDISPIGALEPDIDAKITVRAQRSGERWLADVKIRDASIVVPPRSGSDLLDPDAPSDLYFSEQEAGAIVATGGRGRVPEKPWLVASIDLGSTRVATSAPVVMRARVNARRLKLSVGKTVGIEGTVDLERGEVEIVERPYQLEPGPEKLRFDGTTDALLAIRLTHEFPSVTLIADVGGRISKPALRLSSQPGTYSQGQLLGFFAGGEPGGDPTALARDVATTVGGSIISSMVGKRVKKVLPIDTFRCEPGSSASGASCTVGYWIGENLFLAYKRRAEPRADEDADEIQLQWHLKRGLLIEAAGFGSRVGGDVLWRRRW